MVFVKEMIGLIKMTLQEKVNLAANELLSQPKIPKRVRIFGIQTSYKISPEDLLDVTFPEGIELYQSNGINSFDTKNKKVWVSYLVLKEDLNLAKIGE